MFQFFILCLLKLLTGFFNQFIQANKLESPVYAEEYCGGAGAAINLLLNDKVSRILFNDADKAIYSFWYSIKHFGQEFLALLAHTPIDLDTWNEQRTYFKSSPRIDSDQDKLRLGFATFYLNRCNRSGILRAGPISGQDKIRQAVATYKIDARFKREPLKSKISAIIKKAYRIEVYNSDALSFLSDVVNEQDLT